MIFPRIQITKDILGITIGYFSREVLARLAVMSLISATICMLFMYFVEDGWIRFFSVCCLSTLSVIISSYAIVFTQNERTIVVELVKKRIHNIFKK